MNKSLVVAVVLIATAALGTAGSIQTAIISPGAAALVVVIPTGQVARILNFVHQGSTPGAASVTINGLTAKVMHSVDYVDPETRIIFNVAGPATLTVGSNGDSSSTISYKLDSNR